MGGGYCVGLSVSGGLREGWEKTNHDESHGSFLGHTSQASHLLGPLSYISLPNSSVEQETATHIPLEGEGWVQLGSILSLLEHQYLGPHPLREGMGLFPDGCVWLGES